MIWLFSIPLLIVAYAFCGYPLLVLLLARRRGKPLRRAPTPLQASLCIAAHNEAPYLAAKLENLLTLAQTENIKEILLLLDGCTDDSQRIVERTLATRPPEEQAKVIGFLFEEGRGKAAALNHIAPHATGDILIMMDVRQRIAPGAITALLESFAEDHVGVVSGELIFEEAAGAAAKGAAAYWGYEKTIRRAESALGCVPGATGALYAIRRPLFQPIPAETLLDDVLIPMRAILAGKTCHFQPAAQAFDQPSRSFAAEEIRKRRTLAGNWQLPTLEPRLLSPKQNPAFFSFFSHKLLRLPTPLLLLLALLLLVIAALLQQTWALILLPLALLGLAASAAAHAFAARHPSRLLGLLGTAYGFNRALLLAFLDACRARYNPRWRRAP